MAEVFETLSNGKLACVIGLIAAVWWCINAKRNTKPLEKSFILGAFAHTAALYVYAVLFFGYLIDDAIFKQSITTGFGQGELQTAFFVAGLEAIFALGRCYRHESAA